MINETRGKQMWRWPSEITDSETLEIQIDILDFFCASSSFQLGKLNETGL